MNRSPIEPARPRPPAYLLGAGPVSCLCVSVLLHELGHALACHRFGIGVRGVTLEMLGGYTGMDRDAPGPRADAAPPLLAGCCRPACGAPTCRTPFGATLPATTWWPRARM